jgi:uncharacterized protein (TIGR03435 family)
MLRTLSAIVFFFTLPSLLGQTPAAPIAFEVATIKPSDPITPAAIASGKMTVGMHVDASRASFGFLSIADLIPIAFKVKPYQVSGPDWMRSQRFDIVGKLPDGSTKEQVPEMLQVLLAERFQLKVHRENREQPIYALIVAIDGHKLKDAIAEQEKPADGPGAVTFGAGENQVRVNPGRGGATVVTSQTGTTRVMPGPDGQMRMEMSKVNMAAFAEMLTPLLDRPVVDMTDLKGDYQVALDLSMDVLLNVARSAGIGIPAAGARGGVPGQPVAASDPTGGSIFTSVQQLGLRLESRRAPVEVVVVDHVEKMPTEN